MKKILIAIFVSIIIVVAISYGILFTQPGNNLIKPIVETKINKALKSNLTLTQFSLRPSSLSLRLKTQKGSTLTIKGNFGIFSRNVNITYILEVSSTENNLKFGKIELKGPFWIKGKITGYLGKTINIKGSSNFANSHITYEVTTENNKLSTILVRARKLQLKNILSMLNKPIIANANIRLDINIKNFKKGNLKGKAYLVISKGAVYTKAFKKIYNIHLRPTSFNAESQINLNGYKFKFSAHLHSNVFTGKINGTFNQENEEIYASYHVNIPDLSFLKPITNMNLKGSLTTNGVIKGILSNLIISGKTNIANSNTKYEIVLNNKKVKYIHIYSKDAKLEKILYTIGKPPYLYGTVDANIKLNVSNINKLNGLTYLEISKGTLNRKNLRKILNLSIPRTTFNIKIASNIRNGVANAEINLHTSLFSLITKKTKFTIHNLKLISDYILHIPNLGELYFITKRKMRGSLTLKGNIKYSKGHLKSTALSNIWNGKLFIVLNNNKLKGNIKNINIADMLYTMGYSKIFKSKGNINFTYNLFTKKGNIKAIFKNGHIIPNKLTILLFELTGFNISKEIYRTTTINSKINNGKIYSNLYMTGELTKISSKNAFINLPTNYINAKLKIDIKGNSANVKLKGNLNHPKIELSLKGLIKHKIENKAEKLLQKIFK